MLQAQAPTIIHYQQTFHQQVNQFPTQVRKKIENYSFCLTDKIGKGFSSVVYKGKNDLTNQTVAIKVIQLQSLRDQITRSLLQAQLQCMKRINHPNLLKCFDSYKTLNNCYIITQFCEGGDLEKQLRQKGRFSQNEFIKFFAQFYAGYQSFLNSGYIHRDLKPANIFIKGDQIKIADFGMIKKLTQNPRDNYNVGTPVYMPPQSLLSNIYTQKSDVWSIGIMCYHLTHGILPWKGSNQHQLKMNIQNNRVFYDYNLISMDLIKFIDKCLQKNPHNRLSIFEMQYHPWMVKSVMPLVNLNRESLTPPNNIHKSLSDDHFSNNNNNNLMQNLSTNVLQKLTTNYLTPGCRQGSFHFPNQKNISHIPSRNASNPKPSSVNIQNNSIGNLLTPLQMVPSLQICQNKQNNDNMNVTYKQLKSQRLTMDSDEGLPQRRKFVEQNKQNQNNNQINTNNNHINNSNNILTNISNHQNNINQINSNIKKTANSHNNTNNPTSHTANPAQASSSSTPKITLRQKQKKSTLQYLISILNYLRYIHKIYKMIQESNNTYIPQNVCNSLKSLLVKQLIKCLANQEKIIKNKINVYGLSPNSWEEFIKSKKWNTYVNVVQQYSAKYRKTYDQYITHKQNSNKNINSQQLNYRRISQPLKTIIENLHRNVTNTITNNSNQHSQNKQMYKLIEILDYLVTVYNLEQLIFCYGWLIFVEKSPINQIVEYKCLINAQNYRDVWGKLQKKINCMSKF